MPDDLGEPHQRELARVGDRLAARRTHARTRDTDEPRLGEARTQRLDEGRAEVVPRGLARDQRDDRTGARHGPGGVSAPGCASNDR